MGNGTLQRLDLLDIFFGERIAKGRAMGVVGREAEKEGGMIDVAPALDDGEDWGESEMWSHDFLYPSWISNLSAKFHVLIVSNRPIQAKEARWTNWPRRSTGSSPLPRRPSVCRSYLDCMDFA